MVGPREDTRDVTPSKVTAFDQAWDALIEYTDAAPAGSRLPSERSLAERLGVSRSTLRSALSRLELLGYVEVRHGSGIVVRRPDPQSLLTLLLRTGGREESASSALALRSLIEPPLTALAARKPASSDLKEAEESADDMRFHSALARASGNELAGSLIGALVALSGGPSISDELHEAQHAVILAALKNGDEASARDAMRQHLRTLARAVDGTREGRSTRDRN